MLWVDRYRPKTLDALITNKEAGANLKNLVRLIVLSPLHASGTIGRCVLVCISIVTEESVFGSLVVTRILRSHMEGVVLRMKRRRGRPIGVSAPKFRN